MFGLGLKLGQRGGFGPRMLFARGEAGAWYDPADLSSMFQDSAGTVPAALNGPVGRINDKSGRGNHAVQAAAGSRPTLRQENGRWFLEFDGNDDWLRVGFAIAQPWERVSGLRQSSWTEFDRIFGGASVMSGELLQGGGPAPSLRMRSSAGSGIVADTAAIGADVVVAERHSGAASRIIVNRGAAVTGDGGTIAVDGITIGNRETTVNASHFRLYGLAMIGRALKDEEALRLRRFMAAKSGAAF